MCIFAHACVSPGAPVCFGVWKWHTSLCGQVATVEKCPWLLARSGLCTQRGSLSLASLCREDQLVGDVQPSAVALILDTELLRLWGKLKHLSYLCVCLPEHLIPHDFTVTYTGLTELWKAEC